MRGGTSAGGVYVFPAVGLSPHARGNPCGQGLSKDKAGPIPACAGEPVTLSSCPRPPRAYPRMRGGTPRPSDDQDVVPGLSPHARGNPWGIKGANKYLGPIPACAGEPFHQGSSGAIMRAYPRMRGGTGENRWEDWLRMGLSPHARGNLEVLADCVDVPGPIPACAGEPAALFS